MLSKISQKSKGMIPRLIALDKQKEAVVQFLGVHVEWIEADKACRIVTFAEKDIKKGASSWVPMFDWLSETAINFKEMIKKFYV